MKIDRRRMAISTCYGTHRFRGVLLFRVTEALLSRACTLAELNRMLYDSDPNGGPFQGFNLWGRHRSGTWLRIGLILEASGKNGNDSTGATKRYRLIEMRPFPDYPGRRWRVSKYYRPWAATMKGSQK